MLVRKAQLLKLEMDGLASRMDVLKLEPPSEKRLCELGTMAERAYRIARHIARYRKFQLYLLNS